MEIIESLKIVETFNDFLYVSIYKAFRCIVAFAKI